MPKGWLTRDSGSLWLGGGAGPSAGMGGMAASTTWMDEQDCQRADEAECRCQEEGRPGGGGQGESGQVDDRARTQG